MLSYAGLCMTFCTCLMCLGQRALIGLYVHQLWPVVGQLASQPSGNGWININQGITSCWRSPSNKPLGTWTLYTKCHKLRLGASTSTQWLEKPRRILISIKLGVKFEALCSQYCKQFIPGKLMMSSWLPSQCRMLSHPDAPTDRICSPLTQSSIQQQIVA